MMQNQETIDGLIQCIDEAISKRDRDFANLDAAYKKDNGHIMSSEYPEYKRRKDRIIENFNVSVLDYERKLDSLCQRVRKKQPSLNSITEDAINATYRFPRRIALGKYRVQYENLDIYVPRMFKFPFEKPMYICEDDQVVLFHKVILRLVFALPKDRQQYYIFDPFGLGKSLWNFNSLFSNESLFPQKKVMTTSNELKDALKGVMDYMQSLYSGAFDLATDTANWDAYNRRMYSQHNYKKVLPYKVFVFTSVPEGMDAECFEMFRKLVMHSEECGFLVLFSFNELLLDAEDSRMKSTELELRRCIDGSVRLHRLMNSDPEVFDLKNLAITNMGEKFPNDESLNHLLLELDAAVSKSNNTMFSFEEMLDETRGANKNSEDGLAFPIGYTTSGSGEVMMEIDDRTPHYLIGGTTGSGKSNLLHNLIMSASWNYSPEELIIYLLDFKAGVEFSRYADPILPNAALVAVEADTEYGITVLDYLLEEQENRFNKFKLNKSKDIVAFRKSDPVEMMPRILVVIDEFQVLFAGATKDSAVEKMTMLAKQGRACGIHIVLSTQSLKNLDISSITPQFGGRIALKCSAEDSKNILGGITTNNEAASEIEIPFAIMNTAQGSVAGNIKFAVPEAKSDLIEKKIQDIQSKCSKDRINIRNKIFEGQRLPEISKADFEKIIMEESIVIGQYMNYEANLITLKFKPKAENNLLICGHDDAFKKHLIENIVISTLYSLNEYEIVYIGDNHTLVYDERVQQVSDLCEYTEKYKVIYKDKPRIILMDNCNPLKDIGFPPPQYGTVSEEGKAFKEYWDVANKHRNHFIVIYDSFNRLKNSGIPMQDFQYRIGFGLNGDEKNNLLSNTSYGSASMKSGRAFFADNLEIKGWFRPFRIG
ncbi:DNA translocase FtsK [Hominisplanchenecus murintestinalis]|uniref:DNA translocase FtsK n=1 Tax=Hominisplanchenecus murintestinalis TaxID=2941517 RepID=A0AC61QZZ1_9FIRM|nr:DNA translocase FtsK [Hominisplanchenecus murintestinalis]